MVTTDVSVVLVVAGLGCVDLLKVTMTVGKLLLHFMVSGRLVKLDTGGEVTV